MRCVYVIVCLCGWHGSHSTITRNDMAVSASKVVVPLKTNVRVLTYLYEIFPKRQVVDIRIYVVSVCNFVWSFFHYRERLCA